MNASRLMVVCRSRSALAGASPCSVQVVVSFPHSRHTQTFRGFSEASICLPQFITDSLVYSVVSSYFPFPVSEAEHEITAIRKEARDER
jgi:hypothetical protein